MIDAFPADFLWNILRFSYGIFDNIYPMLIKTPIISIQQRTTCSQSQVIIIIHSSVLVFLKPTKYNERGLYWSDIQMGKE